MREFDNHLEYYKNYWFADFSSIIPSKNWGNVQQAESFLQKYWLSESEYLSFWKPIQNKIFIQKEKLPNLIFLSGFKLIALKGGCLFMQEDFSQLQKVMKQVGDEYFVVIQHSQKFTQTEPLFRMKFPADITWEELTSGNYISAVLLEMGLNQYYVFGSKSNWGKYSANDYLLPIDFLGFKPELYPIVKNYFKQTKEEKEEIKNFLPEKYKMLIE